MYLMSRSDDAPDVIKLGFSCNCYKQIMENGGQDMLDACFKDNQLPKDQWLTECDLTLAIDASTMQKTQSK